MSDSGIFVEEVVTDVVEIPGDLDQVLEVTEQSTAVTFADGETLAVGIVEESVHVVEIHDEPATVIEVIEEVTDVVEIVTEGGQGPPGPPGTNARVEFDVEAGFNISAYQVICPRMLDDSVRIASNTIGSHGDRPLWLATQSALTGETLRAVSSGRVDNSGWNWIQAPIYLGVNGVMTQTPPDGDDGAVFAAQLGYAISPTSMFFDRFTPIFLPM